MSAAAQVSALPPHNSHLSKEQRRKLYEDARQLLPVGRIGIAEDVARAVLFVATNPYVTGSVVTIDGGVLSHNQTTCAMGARHQTRKTGGAAIG